MAIIYSYPEPAINVGMRLIGSDTTQTGNPTININLGALAEFILAYFNNSGTPNTHAMFITSTTIGDSYINQTAPTFVGAAQIYSNENHWMTKQLVVDGNLYVQPSADKADIWANTTSITGTMLTIHNQDYKITTTLSQVYNGTEDHNSQVNFHNNVDFGDLTTINVDTAIFYHKLHVYGNLLDKVGSAGSNTQILSSSGVGTGVMWTDQLASGLVYQGIWNADTNDTYPGSLASGVGTPGHYWIVSEDGTTNLDGFNSWQIGDWAVFSSANVWQEIDNSTIFSGAGTPNTMTRWTGITTLGDSQSTDDGTNVNITPTGQLDLGGSPIEITSAINEINVNSKIDLLSKVNLLGTTECTGPFIDAFLSQGNVGQVLSSTAGQVQWIDGSAITGAITGSGTPDYIARWTPTGTALGDSQIQDDGTSIDGSSVGSTAFLCGSGGAGEFSAIALDAASLISNNNSVYIKTLGTGVTDKIQLRAYDPVGFDQRIELFTDTGVSADVSEFSIVTKPTGGGINLQTLNPGALGDITLSSADQIIMKANASYDITGGPWVFNNTSVRFNEPILDLAGSAGLAGDVLKNDGTGKITWGTPSWIQEAKIFEASVTITAAELLNIATAKKVLIPALGANLVIQAVAVNFSKAAGVAYDFPADLYTVEDSLAGIPQAKQTILSAYWTNTVSLTNTTCNAVASGSWVDGVIDTG